jgi:hypothetical protein
VLTRDTLSITFFELGIQWNYQAHYLVKDCEYAARSQRDINCAEFNVQWNSPVSESVPAPPEDQDRLLLRRRRFELGRALLTLRRLQSELSSIMTVTANGERSDLSRDMQLFNARAQQCRTISVAAECIYEAADLKYPFDWMTAQVDLKTLQPDVLARLHNEEIDTQRSLSVCEEAHNVFSKTHSVGW